MKSLLIISPGFPRTESESTCLPSQQLFVRCINELYPELKIVIVSLHYPNQRSEYTWFGNRVMPLGGSRHTKFLRPLLWREAFTKVIKLFRKEATPVGVISFWCQEAALIGNMVSSKLRIPHRIWISGQDARRGNRWLWLFTPKPDELVAMSDFLVDEFERNHNIRPAHVIYNAIDPKNLDKDRNDRKIDLAFVGSLIKLKQPNFFVDVVGKVSRTTAVTAMVIGTGPEHKSLKDDILRNNLARTITLAGELGHDEVIQTLRNTKILVHPSNYEGYSTVCLEALTSGCHVISFTFPEKKPIPNWHVVQSVEEMAEVAAKLLMEYRPAHPVIVHDMRKSALQFMKFFLDNTVNA